LLFFDKLNQIAVTVTRFFGTVSWLDLLTPAFSPFCITGIIRVLKIPIPRLLLAPGTGHFISLEKEAGCSWLRSSRATLKLDYSQENPTVPRIPYHVKVNANGIFSSFTVIILLE